MKLSQLYVKVVVAGLVLADVAGQWQGEDNPRTSQKTVRRQLQDDPLTLASVWQETDEFSVNNPASADQRLALASFYYSLGGPDWINNTGWLTDSPECEWYSSAPDNEACDMNGTYVSLNLTENGLTGPFEGALNSVLALESIVRLDVGSNDLTGSIPTELGLATSLAFLIINENNINSTIPTEVGSVSLLRQFSAQANDVSIRGNPFLK